MPSRSLLRTASLAVLALGLAAALSPAMTAAPTPAEPSYGSIAADRAPALVTIKFVISISQGGQSRELDREAGGIVIDSKAGLVLASNLEMGGGFGTHKDIKVLIGDDTEGVPAKVVGRDTEMELMWLRIEAPDAKGYSAVDTSKGTSPKVGDHLVGLDRMGKYYDRAVVAFDTVVGGITKKPRQLFIPVGGAIGNLGLPLFASTGEFVGVSVLQRADMEEGADPSNSGRQTSYDRGLKILPASEIATATQRALEAEKAGKPMGDEPSAPTPAPEGGEMKEPAPAPAPSPAPAGPKK